MTYLLTYFLAFLLAFFHFFFDIFSDISSHMSFDIFSDISSDKTSDILSDFFFDISIDLLLLFGCPGCPFFGGFLVLFFHTVFVGFILNPVLCQDQSIHKLVLLIISLLKKVNHTQKQKGMLTYLKGITHTAQARFARTHPQGSILHFVWQASSTRLVSLKPAGFWWEWAVVW